MNPSKFFSDEKKTNPLYSTTNSSYGSYMEYSLPMERRATNRKFSTVFLLAFK